MEEKWTRRVFIAGIVFLWWEGNKKERRKEKELSCLADVMELIKEKEKKKNG